MKKKNISPVVSTVVSILLIAAVFMLANYPYFLKEFSFWYWKNTGQEEPPVTAEFREPNTIYIPTINTEAPLVYINETGEKVYQEALARGVVHYPGSALPGEGGNAYYFGHSSDFVTKPGKYKTVFALLPHIKVGDEIAVTDNEGKVYKYTITETKVVGPTDTSVLEQGDRKEKLITLQTSYPVGTALKRFLAIGKLNS